MKKRLLRRAKVQLPRHVTITYNSPTSSTSHPLAPTTSEDTYSTAYAIRDLLESRGVTARLFPIRSVGDLNKLRKIRTNLVFNCVEDDLGATPLSDHLVVKLLAEIGVPFTGGSAGNILLTTNKAAAKQFLLTHGIPTPAFAVVDNPDFLDMTYHLRSHFPLIVKPVACDGSEGVTQKSIVTAQPALRRQVNHIVKVFEQPALVEQFINTREVNIAVIEKGGRPVLLPPSEIHFERGYGQKYKIVDFAAKWRPNTPQYRHTPGICPAPLTPTLEKKLREITLLIWKLLNLASYARVDFRVNERSSPFVLEVNVNPDISNDPQVGFIRSAAAAGLAWEDVILTIASEAWKKHRR